MNLDYQRARFETQLKDECSISAAAGFTSDGKGGRIPTPAITGYYACSLIPQNGQIDRGDRQVERGSYRLRLPWSATVKVGDTIALLGATYTVKWAPPAKSEAYSRLIGMDEAKN